MLYLLLKSKYKHWRNTQRAVCACCLGFLPVAHIPDWRDAAIRHTFAQMDYRSVQGRSMSPGPLTQI